ncbi:MFS transporter [Pontimonas sp.]|uniref:MFS transporter n=1 Tax=Pontimonas sp. TaxID=2304492 RepID=UPI00287084D2|nr:MFS transporter [Pontimonas sp.]MDR9434737.1 MFS transporter [Pontimonas sp.]
MTDHTPAGSNASVFPLRVLMLLATAVFVSVTAEFMPTGLLPQIARGLEVSEAQVGLLVTIFAATVVLTAMALSILTRRYSRKSLVVAALIVMALSNVLAAVAPSFAVMVAARVVGGLAHGLFFALANAYAAYLVPRERLGRAVAILTAGGTMAFVLGVPLGTALGNAFGWRLAFIALAVIILSLALALMVTLPQVSREVALSTGEIALPVRRDPTLPLVLVAALIVVLALGGHNTFYVYIAPYLIDVAGFEGQGVAGVLFVYGGAGALGVAAAGVLGDRFPRGALVGMLLVATVSIAMLGARGTGDLWVISMVVIWAAAFGGIPALLQLRLLRAVSVRLRDFGSAVLVTAFNVGIGGGALVGAVLYDPIGVQALAYAGASGFALAVLVAVVADRIEHLRASSPHSHQG